MNLHNAPTIEQSRKAFRKLPISVAILIVVLIGLAAAIIYRVAEPGSHAKPAATTAQTSVAPAATSAGSPKRGLTFYLVGSRDQANAIQSALNDAAAASGNGELVPPSDLPESQVLVAGTSAEQAAAQQAIKDEIDYRLGLGLPPVSVVDLRQNVNGSPPPCPSATVQAAC